MNKIVQQLHSLSGQVLFLFKAIDRNSYWQPGVTGFIAVAALANTVLYHKPLFTFAAASLDLSSRSGVQVVALLFMMVTVVTIMMLSLLSLVSLRLLKSVCMIAVLANALASYFVETYGVVLDKSMMGNIFNTNFAEAGSFFHPKMLVYLLVLGLLPCGLLARVRLQKVRWCQRLTTPIVTLLIGAGWIYASSTSWLWVDKNARTLGGMILPWSYVINASRYHADLFFAAREQQLLPAANFVGNEKTIVVLVIGEAARAQNFSQYGYQRLTNPLMTQAGAVVLPHSHSCATYTTAALACILSHDDGGNLLSSLYEPLPSYLQRHGIDVIWRTRNWGEPRLKVQSYQRAEELRPVCEGDGCDYDEVLLQGLEQRIQASTQRKILVILHQHGSHGPDYYADYPARFASFTPVCKSVELQHCTNEQLVNAYDNTLLYSDYFLQRAVGLLAAFSDAATMMMYISDHGESLGEQGLYLHGTPYAIAPDVQKDIPFLVWMSAAFKTTKTIASTQLAPASTHSQANVFHSIMGAFDMRSEIYDPQLDIFSPDSQ